LEAQQQANVSRKVLNIAQHYRKNNIDSHRVIVQLCSEYVIKGPKPWEARVYLGEGGEEIAEIKKAGDQKSFKLLAKDGREWIITKSIHGKFRPFSISVIEQGKDKDKANIEVLTIIEHIFKHGDKFYMLTNHPEGKHWNEYLSGPRYISRLDNFPYSDIHELDYHIKHKLRRFRGIPVGGASGLGIHGGHRVKIDNELKDISLPIAVSSYLLYSTA
jgi:hypothetical protein